MTRRLSAGAVAIAAVAFAITLAAEPLKDDAILGLANRFRLDWNTHDTTAMAELFTADADFVDVAGTHWKGRRQIRDEHVKSHRMQFKDSVLTFRSVDVRFLKPDVALVHIDWRIEGDRASDGTSRAPRNGVMSWVVVRQRDDWRIASSHNTNVRAASTTP
jgi:uncharacterized protein (TIGR02246 family)